MSREYYVQCSPFAVQATPTGRGRGHTYLGMDCESDNQQHGSGLHHLMNEQAKSLAALHELQNEVGALLEFRDLVIETFPHLRSKMASQPSSSGALSSSNTTPNSSSTGMSHIPVPTTRREWEPGIRVKRKLGNKDHEANSSSLTTSRSRSNSQGSKYQTSQLLNGATTSNGSGSSSAGSSAIQDSGFGTESKEHYSASSSTSQRGGGVSVASAEDELWNLLDVIHRKGTKLRQEVEHLQVRLQDKDGHGEKYRDRDRGRARSLGSVPSSDSTRDLRGPSLHPRERLSRSVEKCFGDEADEYLDRVELVDDDSDSVDFRTQRLLELGKEEVRSLRRERDLLLDRLAEMEAEMLASRARASHLKNELGVVSTAKRELEDRLQSAISQKSELNSRIHDLHLQFVKNTGGGANGNLLKPVAVPSPKRAGALSQIVSSQTVKQTESSCFTPVLSSTSQEEKRREPISQLRFSKSNSAELNSLDGSPKVFHVIERSEGGSVGSDCASYNESVSEHTRSEFIGRNVKLGALDGIVSCPSEIPLFIRGVAPDGDRIAAVLKETDHVELQRHLLTTMAENKALRLRSASEQRVREGLAQQLDTTKEENDDLKFQLEERSIELEGTRARVRVLEKIHHSTLQIGSPVHAKPVLQNITVGDETSNQQHSSSTESAHDTEGQRAPTCTPAASPTSSHPAHLKAPISPRRRPSKIPLVKSYCAPKPPGSKTNQDGASNSTGTSMSSTGRDTLKRRKAGSSPASRGTSIPDGATLSWRQRRDSSPSLGPVGRSRDSLSSGGIGRSSSASVHHGSRESLGGPRSRSTPAKNDGTLGKNLSLASSSSLSRRELAKSRDSVHSSPGGRKFHTSQVRRSNVSSTSVSRTNLNDTEQSKARSTRLFSWGNWWKIGILDSPS
ncbi:hypothetical protein ONE63_002939 [Megalurothrips usitatus]|uniref:Uncharacterized protein n=1 Tax=Megalurothrips usitatus TaxID=439358 RepID=A0AAV7XCD2_9NEOP|nr:hypothetical protein ONE63_002939 [Megalurothrips usitatus]